MVEQDSLPYLRSQTRLEFKINFQIDTTISFHIDIVNLKSVSISMLSTLYIDTVILSSCGQDDQIILSLCAHTDALTQFLVESSFSIAPLCCYAAENRGQALEAISENDSPSGRMLVLRSYIRAEEEQEGGIRRRNRRKRGVRGGEEAGEEIGRRSSVRSSASLH